MTEAPEAAAEVDAAPEWVLLVPPPQTERVYRALQELRCVARPWELPGRTGARIHRHSAVRVGIPIAYHETLLQVLKDADDSESDAPFEAEDPGRFLRQILVPDASGDDAAQLIRKPYTPSKTARIYEEVPFDARIHPKRARNSDKDHTLTLPGATSSRQELKDRPPAFTYAELFAGIGGFGVALERLGGACVFCSELEESCRDVYALNFPGTACLVGDIHQVRDENLPQSLDLLVAGFPCQPFSSLGQQPGLACPTKGDLFLEIVRVLRVSQPHAFLLENVPGLCELTEDLKVIVTALEDAGYEVSMEVCNARALVASSRKRLYLVGLKLPDAGRGAPFEFPYVPDLKLRARDVLSYEDDPAIDWLRVTEEQLRRLRSEKYWRPAHLAWPNTVCATLVSHYGNAVAKGGSQLAPCRRGNPRRFAPRECARLMGFPDSYQLPRRPRPGQGAMACAKEQYRMLGNAVCPPLVAALAGAVLARCPGIRGYRDHDDWVAWGRACAVAIARAATITHGEPCGNADSGASPTLN